jgi:hypothetical protein
MPGTSAALFLIVIFMLPGFLTVRLVMGRLPVAETSDTHSIVFAVLFSTLIHLLISPFTLRLIPKFESLYNQISNLSGGPVTADYSIILWIVTVLLIGPLALAEALSSLLRWRPIQPMLGRYGASLVDLLPRAWDWSLFSSRGAWVVVQLKGGTLVGGEFGANSFASLSPEKPDLFIERIYKVSDKHEFLDPVRDSAGAWIDGSAIDIVHFYRAPDALGDK